MPFFQIVRCALGIYKIAQLTRLSNYAEKILNTVQYREINGNTQLAAFTSVCQLQTETARV